MENMMLGILCINLILVVIYEINCAHKGEKKWLVVLFIVLPLIGFGLYFIPKLMMKMNKNSMYDRDSLVKRYDVESVQVAPILKKELNVIPIEDAMAISSNQEKRNLLLEQLKKDMQSKYKVILPAGSDKDSESAHYVAAAKMEVYRKKREEQIQIQNKLEKAPYDISLLHEYLESLTEYVNSGLLADREAAIYKVEYCKYFNHLQVLPENRIRAEESTSYLTYLISLEQYDEAREFWKSCPDENKEESGYMKMLEMYYNRAEKKKFFDCLHELEETDITLSPEGLKILRFWIARRK